MNSNQSPTGDHSALVLEDLQNLDIHALVTAFVQSEANLAQPLVRAVISLLDNIAANLANLQRLVVQLLSTLTDRQFYIGLIGALRAHIEAHP